MFTLKTLGIVYLKSVMYNFLFKNSCERIGMKMISMEDADKREFFLNMLERDRYEYFWAGAKIRG